MSNMLINKFRNIDERYGDPELCTIEDLQELNPEGEFIIEPDGIYEQIDGVWRKVAECEQEDDTEIVTSSVIEAVDDKTISPIGRKIATGNHIRIDTQV